MVGTGSLGLLVGIKALLRTGTGRQRPEGGTGRGEGTCRNTPQEAGHSQPPGQTIGARSPDSAFGADKERKVEASWQAAGRDDYVRSSERELGALAYSRDGQRQTITTQRRTGLLSSQSHSPPSPRLGQESWRATHQDAFRFLSLFFIL